MFLLSHSIFHISIASTKHCFFIGFNRNIIIADAIVRTYYEVNFNSSKKYKIVFHPVAFAPFVLMKLMLLEFMAKIGEK